MDTHISFIHRVYTSARAPLNAITSWFNGDGNIQTLETNQLP